MDTSGPPGCTTKVTQQEHLPSPVGQGTLTTQHGSAGRLHQHSCDARHHAQAHVLAVCMSMLTRSPIQHDVKLDQQDLGPAWQAGCYAQAPYRAGPYQGVCSTAVAEYTRGVMAGVPLIKTGWKSGHPRRGMGKVPSSLGRRAYLSRTYTTRRAKSCR
jgi:hypothetical protein